VISFTCRLAAICLLLPFAGIVLCLEPVDNTNEKNFAIVLCFVLLTVIV
jgi:hypothetical protein